MNRFDGKPVYHCMVEGCSNEMDPGSTQSLCRPCYEVITTGNIERYYADHHGSTWIGQIISWNHNLRQEVKELEYNQEHAYSFEDGTMSLNDLRNFYVEHKKYNGPSVIDDYKRALDQARATIRQLEEKIDSMEYDQTHAYTHEDGSYSSLNDLRNFYVQHKNYAETIAEKQSLRLALDKKNSQNLSLIHENQALKKGHEQKDQYIDSLRKEIEALNYNIDHAHQIDFGKYMSLDDLCVFYQEHNNSPPKDDGRFQAYTDGFYKGFDLGFEKAKDQYYE